MQMMAVCVNEEMPKKQILQAINIFSFTSGLSKQLFAVGWTGKSDVRSWRLLSDLSSGMVSGYQLAGYPLSAAYKAVAAGPLYISNR